MRLSKILFFFIIVFCANLVGMSSENTEISKSQLELQTKLKNAIKNNDLEGTKKALNDGAKVNIFSTGVFNENFLTNPIGTSLITIQFFMNQLKRQPYSPSNTTIFGGILGASVALASYIDFKNTSLDNFNTRSIFYMILTLLIIKRTVALTRFASDARKYLLTSFDVLVTLINQPDYYLDPASLKFAKTEFSNTPEILGLLESKNNPDLFNNYLLNLKAKFK